MTKKIAIIGTSEQQNPLILKAKEMGFETHTFAWQTGGEIGEQTSDFFYPISASNKEAILEKCREIGVSAIASIASDIAAVTVAYACEALGLPSHSFDSVARATNKIKTRTVLLEQGILQPAFVPVADTLPLQALQGMQYPLIVKPSDRSAGRGLMLVENEAKLFSAINAAREASFERQAIVEEYIAGALYSCECVSCNGEHTVLGFTKRSTLRIGGRICEHKHSQPATLPTSVEKKMTEESKKILNALGLSHGASSIEFIVDKENKPYVIEVTPTMYGDYIGTHLIPAAYGCDYTKIVLDLACGCETEIAPCEMGQLASVRFFYSAQDGCADAPAVPDGTRYGHAISVQPLRAFGGCPALPVKSRRPYYEAGESVLALNSEYTAFWCALKQIGAKCVHLPHYASSAWQKVADELSVTCKYYHIDTAFLPTDLAPEDEDAVLLINYHGLCSDYIRNAPFKYKIVDNSMAFFEPPILEENVYSIYSCRKFFAVTDGAYLIGASLRGAPVLEKDVSYKRATALLHALECGGAAAYKDMQTGEQELFGRRAAMSALTEKLLASVDYESEKETRKRQFAFLHAALAPHNRLSIDPSVLPISQFYPLLVNADARDRLIRKKIYVPLMWRKTLAEQFSGLAERALSERLLCLPLSSEYSDEDMEYLLANVLASIT